MTTREALLADILANPDDDLRRLVYADWLEENRDPEQAAFIRAQVAGHTGKAEFRAWGDRYMTDDPGAGHLIPHLNESGGPTVEYRRGFVHTVRCTLSQWCGAGVCRRCDGRGHSQHEDINGDFYTCPTCRGTGEGAAGTSIVGIGPAVVRSHPVTRVDMTDREPYEAVQASFDRQDQLVWSRNVWVWLECDDVPTQVHNGHTMHQNCVPELVAKFLSGGRCENMRHRQYFAQGEAEKDLSAALIAWAKSQPVT